MSGSDPNRLCIGCIHFYFRPNFEGHMGSEWTGRYGEHDAALLCKREHWQQEMNGGKDVPFGEHMTRARTCEDYEERSHG